MKTFRLFFAICFDNYTKESLYKIQNQLLNSSISKLIRIIKKQNLHLTLNFLGNTPENKIGLLTQILEHTAKKYSQFEINFKGLGCFPDYQNPKVIWSGIENSHNIVSKIYSSLTEDLTKNNFKTDKRAYKAHCTMAYVKKLNTPQNIKHIENKIKELKEIQICSYIPDGLLLIASELTSEGAIYKTIKKFNLNLK